MARWLKKSGKTPEMVMKILHAGKEPAGYKVAALRDQVTTLETRVAELDAAKKRDRQRLRRLSAQYQVSAILAESTSLNTAAMRILQTICECLELEFGGHWLFDGNTNLLHCREIWHRNSGGLCEFETISRQITFAPGIGL